MAVPLTATIIVSVLVSTIVSNAIAAAHFKVIDGYVKDVVELAKKYMADAYKRKGG